MTDRDAGYLEGIEAAWPSGCHDPDSCQRHRHCMYVQCRRQGRDIAAEIDAATRSLPLPSDDAKAESVVVKLLAWRDHRPDSFPEPAWSAETPFGFYHIEQVCASDSPAYVVRLHAHHFIADKDGLNEAKEAAQADYEMRIRSALVLPSPASDGAIRVTDEIVDYIGRYGGTCRDCADENGICPHSGLPCANRGKAIRHVLTALNYGIANGFIPAHAGDAAK